MFTQLNFYPIWLQLEGAPPSQVIATHDPNLVANGLPKYPHLPATLDSGKIAEIRRTLVAMHIGLDVS
jgi:hypothetical protein